jgi:glycosyltransferase involved in cell wall biosynthesis
MLLAEASSTHRLSHDAARPLRVLVVTGIYPTLAAPHLGTFVKNEVDSLVAAGVEVAVIHPNPGPVPLRYAAAAIAVLRKARAGRFDVVHGYYGQWCALARLQWTTPVVASFLGSDLLGVYTAGGSFDKVGGLVERLSRWLCHHVDAVIVMSDEMRRAVSARRTFVIPQGVDFELFRPIPQSEARATLGWAQDGYFVLFGNNPRIAVKNYPLAQAAIQHLRARGISAELVVASGLPQTQVVQYLNASNALILPSMSEGSPCVVKEAMACNVPVVATDVGDVAQVIGRTQGCYVCPQDADALASALELALRHPGRTTGRADVSHLERSAIARQIVGVYEQVCVGSERQHGSSAAGRTGRHAQAS